MPVPFFTATVAYQTTGSATGYDELGRVVSRTIDGANPVSTTFDALGRVTGVSNALGAFTYAYLDETSRLKTVTYPVGTGGTGQSLNTIYNYYSNTAAGGTGNGDQRLQEIKNLKGSTQLSKFDYTYNLVGTIATWTQQADSSTAVVNTLSYDNADELTNAVQSGGGSASNAYHYDPAGNRLAEITASTTTAGQFNNLNQLKAITSSSTSTTVAGHTSANITSATIDAVPATITNSTNFTANVPIPSGTNVVSVVAQPTSSSGVLTTQRYQIVASGSTPTSLSYDANGNVTTDENGNGYTWDALNRLTKITYSGGATSNFAYDGLSRRVSIIEKNSGGTVTSTKLYLWIGSEIAEERSAGTTVTKRFFPQGEQQSGTNYYYTRDHEASVREMVDSSGTIVSRLAYDPYGRVTIVSGTTLPTKQYTGDYYHPISGLNLTWRRAYDSNTGRWLSRDPINERGGINLYEYCRDDATNAADRSGLACGTFDVLFFPGDYDGKYGPFNPFPGGLNLPVEITYHPDTKNPKCCCKNFILTQTENGEPDPEADPFGPNRPLRDAPGIHYPTETVDPITVWGGVADILGGEYQSFKTCAVCLDNGKTLGCTTWGRRFPPLGVGLLTGQFYWGGGMGKPAQ